jgi:hypothetical protein
MGICKSKPLKQKKKQLLAIQNNYGGPNRLLEFEVEIFGFRGRNFKNRDTQFVLIFGSKQQEKFVSKMTYNSINPTVSH